MPAKTAFKLENRGVTTCSQCGHGPLSRDTASCSMCRATLMEDPNPKQTNTWLVPSIIAMAACVIGIAVFIPIAFRSSKDSSMRELKAIEKVAQERKDKIEAAKQRIKLAKQQREDETQRAIERQQAEIDSLKQQNTEIQEQAQAQSQALAQGQAQLEAQSQAQSQALAQAQAQAQAQANTISDVNRSNRNEPAKPTSDQKVWYFTCSRCKQQRTETTFGSPNATTTGECPKDSSAFKQHSWVRSN